MQNNGNFLHYAWKYLHTQQTFGVLYAAVDLWLVLHKHRAGRQGQRGESLVRRLLPWCAMLNVDPAPWTLLLPELSWAS